MNAAKILSESAASESDKNRFVLPKVNIPRNDSGDLNVAAPRASYVSILVYILISPGRWARLWRRFNARRPSCEFYDYRDRKAYEVDRARRIASINYNGVKF
jgi:hypothetical protein